jgi:hypothetical protein
MQVPRRRRPGVSHLAKRAHLERSIAPLRSMALLSRETGCRCLHDSCKRQRTRSMNAITRAPGPARALGHESGRGRRRRSRCSRADRRRSASQSITPSGASSMLTCSRYGRARRVRSRLGTETVRPPAPDTLMEPSSAFAGRSPLRRAHWTARTVVAISPAGLFHRCSPQRVSCCGRESEVDC